MAGLMLGLRVHESAKLELRICDALPKHMHAITREVVGLEVMPADRRKGYARELLEQVTSEADTHGLTLIVMPQPFGTVGPDVVDLAGWYNRRFGFLTFQASPLIMARMPGSTPRQVRPVAAAAHAAITRAR